MRSPLPLYCVALAIASTLAVAVGEEFKLPPVAVAEEFKLPPYEHKQLDTKKVSYPEKDKIVDENPDWNALYDLADVPKMPPVIYKDVNDPCSQEGSEPLLPNAECEQFGDEPIKCLNKGHWALTYEEGPTKYTQNILKALDEAGGIKATFFVVGSRLLEYADVLIDAVNAGHEIGINSWSYARLSTLTDGQIIAEIKSTELAIMELTGIKPKYVRPPYGNMDDRVRFIIKKMGYIPVMWTADTEDYKFARASEEEALESIKLNIQKYVESNHGTHGIISLQHSVNKLPTLVVRDVIEYVKEAGWTFVPMTTCLNEESFAQNGVIVACEPHGMITKPAKKRKAKATDSAHEPAKNVEAETSEPAKDVEAETSEAATKAAEAGMSEPASGNPAALVDQPSKVLDNALSGPEESSANSFSKSTMSAAALAVLVCIVTV